MAFKFSLKQAWIILILFAVLVPALLVGGWFGWQLYNDELHSALKVERYANELIRTQIEAEGRRFKTLLKNKSDPLSTLIDKKHHPENLNIIIEKY